jgi:hypothetical protein
LQNLGYYNSNSPLTFQSNNRHLKLDQSLLWNAPPPKNTRGKIYTMHSLTLHLRFRFKFACSLLLCCWLTVCSCQESKYSNWPDPRRQWAPLLIMLYVVQAFGHWNSENTQQSENVLVKGYWAKQSSEMLLVWWVAFDQVLDQSFSGSLLTRMNGGKLIVTNWSAVLV